jgi:hypothetical protein
MAKKQDQLLANVENGFYSRSQKKLLRFDDLDRPQIPITEMTL